MQTNKRSGFTIIEVMLFLAISGALTVAILVGSSVAINQQRYRDSVNSFKGLLQEQYNQIGNVVNTEQENPLCTASGSTITMNDNSLRPRGTSDCLVIGRFLVIEPTQVTAYNLIGLPGANSSTSDDIAALTSYSLAVGSPEVTEIGWGARIVRPYTIEGVTTSLMIVRSPLSGSILTYVQDGNQLNALGGMITNDNTMQKDFCIDSGGLTSVALRRAVRITARAAGQSAIEIPLEKDSICDR